MALRKRRAIQALTAIALLGLLLASAPATACISTHHGGMMRPAGPRASQAPVLSQSNTVTVEIKDYDFFPRDLTVPAGATVTWVNRDSVPHDATDNGGAWATGLLNQGDSKSLVFQEPGTFQYRCSIHPNMTARLTVGSGSTAGAGASPGGQEV